MNIWMHYAKGALLCALGLLAGATSAAAEPAQACPGAQWSLRESAPGVDRSRLAQALDAAMADGRVTRAIVVVYDGAIVAERYAPGYGPDSVFFSYSMAKSFTATLAGILVSQGRLALHAAAPVPEWSAADDPRRSITLAHLLNMSSGIATNESADQLTSDVAAMLFGAGRHDVAHYAANHPLKFAPGSYFAYSNSSSNVISGIIRRSVGDDEASYRRFIDEALFRPLGMASAVASFDARGTFVGSSLISATARDYARLGLLYQRGGECNGQRIVSSSWVDFVRTPAPASGGTYGAHFWIGPHSKALREDAALMATWPKDEFSAGGLFGQVISIAPSKKLVLVMLGHTQYADAAERATLRDRQLARLYAALAGGSN